MAAAAVAARRSSRCVTSAGISSHLSRTRSFLSFVLLVCASTPLSQNEGHSTCGWPFFPLPVCAPLVADVPAVGELLLCVAPLCRRRPVPVHATWRPRRCPCCRRAPSRSRGCCCAPGRGPPRRAATGCCSRSAGCTARTSTCPSRPAGARAGVRVTGCTPHQGSAARQSRTVHPCQGLRQHIADRYGPSSCVCAHQAAHEVLHGPARGGRRRRGGVRRRPRTILRPGAHLPAFSTPHHTLHLTCDALAFAEQHATTPLPPWLLVARLVCTWRWVCSARPHSCRVRAAQGHQAQINAPCVGVIIRVLCVLPFVRVRCQPQLVKAIKRIIAPDLLNPDGTVPASASPPAMPPWDRMHYMWRGALKCVRREQPLPARAAVSTLLSMRGKQEGSLQAPFASEVVRAWQAPPHNTRRGATMP